MSLTNPSSQKPDPSLSGPHASNPFTAELGLLTKLVAPRISHAKDDASLPAPKPIGAEAGRKRRSVPPLNELEVAVGEVHGMKLIRNFADVCDPLRQATPSRNAHAVQMYCVRHFEVFFCDLTLKKKRGRANDENFETFQSIFFFYLRTHSSRSLGLNGWRLCGRVGLPRNHLRRGAVL